MTIFLRLLTAASCCFFFRKFVNGLADISDIIHIYVIELSQLNKRSVRVLVGSVAVL